MTISSTRKDLFRNSTIGDKLNLFQFLFDARELTADLTLALLKVIHEDLNNHQKPDRTVLDDMLNWLHPCATTYLRCFSRCLMAGKRLKVQCLKNGFLIIRHKAKRFIP